MDYNVKIDIVNVGINYNSLDIISVEDEDYIAVIVVDSEAVSNVIEIIAVNTINVNSITVIGIDNGRSLILVYDNIIVNDVHINELDDRVR